ncbi:hypothetical protein COV19_01435 [Candidatus Woesearchaeota archaeon CG10_big_fil_rev_8_21_14_0_10_44_13]|nr:MAG: hypothetical protein COV19_01435 [Candidatus Woesearchaeota archaeon CG10_big_fil_rev_8_21_14_0_10_44_13]
MKLSTIIISAFLIMLLLAGLGSLSYSYISAKGVFEQEVRDRMEVAVESRATYINYYLEENQKSVFLISESPSITSFLKTPPGSKDYAADMETAKTRINSFLQEGVYKIFVVGKEGIVVISTADKELGTNKSNEDYFIEGKKGPYHDSVYYDQEDSKRTLIYSYPFIDDETQEVLGVVVAYHDTLILDALASDYVGLGNTGESFLVNKEFYMVTPSRFVKDAPLNQKVDTQNARSCFQHPMMSEEQIKKAHEKMFANPDYRGVMVVGTHAYLPLMEWCLIVKINKEEAIGTYEKELLRSFIYSFMIAVIFIILAGIILARRISRPINNLAEDVTEITKGRLEIELKPSRIYEVQNLIASMNRILVSLKLAVIKTGLRKQDIGLGEAIRAKEEAEERYESLFNGVKTGFLIVDLDTHKFILANPEMSRITGYPEKELIGSDFSMLHPKEDLHYVIKKFNELVEGKIRVAENIRVLRKNGEIIYCDISATTQNFRGKKVVMGIFIDVTERKETENKYRLLYETSADAIMTIEPPSWKFTAGNPAAIKMFNTKDEKEFISLGPWELSPKKQPDGQPSNEKAKRMIMKAMKEGSNFFEWIHKRYKGGNFPATVLLSRIEEGGKKYLQATVREIDGSI